MNQPEKPTETREFTQVTCTRYFPDMKDFLAESVEDLYKIEVRRILQERAPKKESESVWKFDNEPHVNEFYINEFVSLLFSGINFGTKHNEGVMNMILLYKLEREGLVYPKILETTKDHKWVDGKYLPSVQKIVKRHIEKIKTKMHELGDIEESFSDLRYFCNTDVLCQGCIGYIPNEIMTKLEDYKRCPKEQNVIQPLPPSTYDELKRCTMYFKSRLIELQRKWESILYQETMNAK